MRTRRITAFLVISIGAVAAGTVSLYAATAVGGAGAAAERQQDGQGQEPEAPQRPEGLRLTEREQLGDGSQRVRVGDTQFIFTDILDFTDTANDLFIWGWLPTISGEVSDNGFFGGQKVEISENANVGGDVFMFAQTATISGVIGGDLYAFVADLTIADGARIDGAVHGSSGALTVDGEIGGPVSYAGGAIVINGTIHGDAKLEAGELELGPDAVINGTLSYESAREAAIDPGATVGDVEYFVPRETTSDEDEPASSSNGWLSVWGLIWDGLWLVSSFLVGAIALAIGGEGARKPAARLGTQPALGLGFGFVVAVVFPAAAILAMILIVTIPLGLISLALYVAAAYLARLVAAQALGAWLLAAARGGKEASVYGSLALGLARPVFSHQDPVRRLPRVDGGYRRGPRRYLPGHPPRPSGGTRSRGSRDDPVTSSDSTGTGIRVRSLTKNYGDTAALRGVDLDIEAGGVVGLLGPNGAGKTTMVEILEGLREPSSGEVSVLGLDPARETFRLQQRIGAQLQATQIPNDLTAFEVLRTVRFLLRTLVARRRGAGAGQPRQQGLRPDA